MTGQYSEFSYYSPIDDAVMSRISMADDNGREFFMTIPAGSGRAYREARLTAAEAIVTAIQMGLEPGEVRYS